MCHAVPGSVCSSMHVHSWTVYRIMSCSSTHLRHRRIHLIQIVKPWLGLHALCMHACTCMGMCMSMMLCGVTCARMAWTVGQGRPWSIGHCRAASRGSTCAHHTSQEQHGMIAAKQAGDNIYIYNYIIIHIYIHIIYIWVLIVYNIYI